MKRFFAAWVFLACSIPAMALAGKADEEWFEEDKPKEPFVDLHGYFRLRGELWHNFDLDTYNYTTGRQSTQIPPPISERVPVGTKNPDQLRTQFADTQAFTNMRLRMNPVFNVSEDVKIKMQIDALDNLVLGSTPDTYTGLISTGGVNTFFPLSPFSTAQVPPSDGRNSNKDSILVRRLWAEVKTPVGQLRFGRMGSHWGLGVLANDGNGFDQDNGSTADRIMFLTGIPSLQLWIVPILDFVSEGVASTNTSQFGYLGQPYDEDQLDDVNQWILAIARRYLNEEDKKDLLENGKLVFEGGIYNVFRNQSHDVLLPSKLAVYSFDGGGSYPATTAADMIIRNVKLYIGDLWLKFLYEHFRFELEAIVIKGEIGNDPIDASQKGRQSLRDSVDITQFGGVVQTDYAFLQKTLKVKMEYGLASGDPAPGFGVRPLGADDIQYTQGLKAGDKRQNLEINNFRFNPDYRVDMILWRELIGTVTDAMYFKPGIEYMILPDFTVGLDVIYSRAMYAESTPGLDANLGLEFDFGVNYKSGDGFYTSLQYGFLIPFAGMDNLGGPGSPNRKSPFDNPADDDGTRIRNTDDKTPVDPHSEANRITSDLRAQGQDPKQEELVGPNSWLRASMAHRLRLMLGVLF
ncbi:MAG: hypothetical protein GMKNLPBB_02404 [Myxococcota bacterium]|nr:hypothetical protein [Myxococcota bacterium]